MNKFLLFVAMVMVTIFTSSFSKKPSPKKAVYSISKSLAYPVAGHKNSLGDHWGASRAGGKRKHKGIDIYARKGTPVVAICDGRIVNKTKTPIGGKTLWLKSADHPVTAYYAHLDKQLVRDGQFVRKGQVIGTVGNTGNARHTPSHLHFGVQQENEWVNPLPFVKKATKVSVKTSAKKNAKVVSNTNKRKKTRR